MKTFITDTFLLHSDAARRLYQDYARELPIIDYHSHLPIAQLSAPYQFDNLQEAWLATDHSKWRAMRTNGVAEQYCTGHATPREKFQAWAETVPKLLRNPLYHWTHLELQRYFGIDLLLDGNTAEEIWQEANRQLKTPAFSTQGLLAKMRVKAVCTTNDPFDTLVQHKNLSGQGSVLIKPTFRPDRLLLVDNPDVFNEWVDQLAKAAGMKRIDSYHALLTALKARHDYFHEAGCRLSNHAMDSMVCATYSEQKISLIFGEIRAGNALNDKKIAQFKTALLHELCVLNHQRGWVQQFHIGAVRNNNTRMMRTVGPQAGFDSMADRHYGKKLARFLDNLDVTNQLTKTILHTLNPKDNAMLTTMIGSFQDSTLAGKIQVACGWWFQNHLRGLEQQIEDLSALSLLSHSIGLGTDSRTFLSYPRHEYFRRVLCNMLGQDIERGLLPRDFDAVGKLVQDVSYYNARRYFGFAV